MLTVRMRKPQAEPGDHARRLPAAWPRAWWAGALVLLAFALVAIVNVRAKHAVVQLGYALSEAARERDELLADGRKLQVEVATLRNPVRLRKLAQESLELVEPAPGQIQRLTSPEGKLALAKDPGR